MGKLARKVIVVKECSGGKKQILKIIGLNQKDVKTSHPQKEVLVWGKHKVILSLPLLIYDTQIFNHFITNTLSNTYNYILFLL